MTSLRRHRYDVRSQQFMCERYLERQKECVWSLFSQEGEEERDAGTDGAEKEIRVFVCFVYLCQKPFFLADIKYQQTQSVLQNST